MELFETIRREYEAGGTILGLAKRRRVHRRIIRQALASALPPERRRAERDQPKLGPVRAFIDKILSEDRQAPRKQRHTAHRIWVRLKQEQPDHPISEATVREYVRQRKEEMAVGRREVFVPQSYQHGRSAYLRFSFLARLGMNSENAKPLIRLVSPQTQRHAAASAVFSLSTRQRLDSKLLPTFPATREYENRLDPSGRYATNEDTITYRMRRPNELPAGAGMYLGSSPSAAPLRASIALLVEMPERRIAYRLPKPSQ